ncbi:paralemmin-3 [Dunckerocampus dactyliophorus]|uniref:paralemmin-3 n=1 Tax=Dunckerocampus dactyliophorus TaxID=161453 RepID=UPI002405B763|nr:paralemmin-3 [Dunckerocampus dactyliophorus]
MDEAEKYKQRLEAIAEKRRLQEEQERAKREMEDEKLRLQQLKRKSLRDQWLMEGAPLSPSSQDSQSPRSFPWASPEVGKNRSQSAEVSGEEEEEETTVGQTEVVEMEEDGVAMLRGAVLQNGDDNNTKRSGKVHADVKAGQTSPRDEDAFVNGSGDLEGHVRQHDGALELWNSQASTTNGPSGENCGSSLLVNVPTLSHTELDEGVVVMRAERVIITDDEEEDVAQQEEQQSEETPPKIPKSAGETVEEVKVSLEASFESVKNETHAEEQTGTNEDGECEDNQMEGPASVVVMQSTAIPQQGPPVAPVPVYSESPPSDAPQAEGEIPAAATEAAGTSSLKASDHSIAKASQFHEVPLSDTQENHTTESEPGEQEPLLEEVKAPSIQKGEAADSQPAGTGTRGEAIQAPKKKSCECCSVM